MLKLKTQIQDNNTGLIYEIEFPTLQHAENFVNNEMVAVGKIYTIIKINGKEYEEWKKEKLLAV